jgi:hypothetical protein
VTRSRTLRGIALAVTAAAALSSCNSHPGAAATVGSESISQGHVDDVARQLCTARSVSAKAQGQQTQQLQSRAARQGAVNLLISNLLSEQYGATVGAEPDAGQVAAALASFKSTIDAMPGSLRAPYEATLRELVSGQLVLVDAGKKQLTAAGTSKVTDQQAYTEGTKLRDAWAAKHADVSVDPRFGRYTKGTLAPSSGSLSVPVSTSAVAGASDQPNTSFVGALPDNQKCG